MFSSTNLAVVATLLSYALAGPVLPTKAVYYGTINVTPTHGDSTSGGCLSSMHYVPSTQACPVVQIQLVDDSAPEKGFFVYDTRYPGSERRDTSYPGSDPGEDTSYPGKERVAATFDSEGWASLTTDVKLGARFRFVEVSEMAEGPVPISTKIVSFEQGSKWYASADASTDSGVKSARLSMVKHDQGANLPVVLTWQMIGSSGQ